MKVKFDAILGRLREKDGSGGDTPTPPNPNSHFTVTTSGDNKTFYADEKESDTLTVTVTLRFDNVPVDANSTPSGWTHTGTGTYERTISHPGTIAAQQWSYTPGGQYGSQTATKSSPSRSLTKVYPAYWGIFAGNDASQPDITAIVASLSGQHRVTANLPTTVVNVPNNTANDAWLWIVTKGSATALNNEFNVNIMRDPVAGKEFTSPRNNSIDLQGYTAYVSQNQAEAGLGFGNVKLTINLS